MYLDKEDDVLDYCKRVIFSTKDPQPIPEEDMSASDESGEEPTQQ